MSAIIRSRGLGSFVSSNSRLFCSRVSSSPTSVAAADQSPADQPIISPADLVDGQNPPPLPPPPSRTGRKSWNFLKLALIGTLTGGVATAGYASYAYTLEEVDERTKAFRASAKHSVKDDTSAFDKFKALAYTSAVTVPAKAIEFYLDMRRLVEEQVQGFTEPLSDKLLPDLHPAEQHVFTLVLDVNETLIYSDWKRDRGWRTFKRPGVDAFLEHLAQFYEIVVYSDQLSMYVDPVIDRLDQKQCIRYKLSRAATRYQDGKHYRDLSKLNRDPAKIIYVSGHALESCLQPENCVQIKPWKLEEDDTQLLDLIPFLEYVARGRPADIRTVLASYQGHDIPKEFLERMQDYQRRMQEQKQHGPFWRR